MPFGFLPFFCIALVFALQLPALGASPEIEWIRKTSPALYQGISRALGEKGTEKFFEHWRPGDTEKLDELLSSFRRETIRFLRDPSQTSPIRPSYLQEFQGAIAEAEAFVTYREQFPPPMQVATDHEINPDGTRRGLHRPDGIAYQIDGSTHRLKIHSLFESKLVRSASSGFDQVQYPAMLKEWQAEGLQIGNQVFGPSEIDLVSRDGSIQPLAETAPGTFTRMVDLYQSGSMREGLEVHSRITIAQDPWTLRLAALSTLWIGMKPYVPDGFKDYLNDIREMIRLYGRLGANGGNEWGGLESTAEGRRIIALLQRYDIELLAIGVGGLAPELLQRMRSDFGVYAKKARAQAVTAPPRPQAAKEDFEAWKRGELRIGDPIQLIQLRLKYDSPAVFQEFLASHRRWPNAVDLTQATPSDAVEQMVEERFFQVTKTATDKILRFLYMDQEAAARFTRESGWRPSREELIQGLRQIPTSDAARLDLLLKQFRAFGKRGWALGPGEAPIFDSSIIQELSSTAGWSGLVQEGHPLRRACILHIPDGLRL